jgi:hypothetical protein
MMSKLIGKQWFALSQDYSANLSKEQMSKATPSIVGSLAPVLIS